MSEHAARYAPHKNAAWRAIDDHVFIITPDNRQHELAGEVETVVWHACVKAPQSVAELTRAVVEAFDVDPEVAEADITEGGSQLVEAEVLAET